MLLICRSMVLRLLDVSWLPAKEYLEQALHAADARGAGKEARPTVL